MTASSELVIQTLSFERALPRLDVATAAEARMNFREREVADHAAAEQDPAGFSVEISNSDSRRTHSYRPTLL